MLRKLFNYNFIILLALFLIGLIVHFKSFQMVPYGDDWTFIYDYIAQDYKPAHVNTNYPGLLSFLTPYGPSILTIGLVHQFFGKNYFVFYLIPLVFRILTAFILFLNLQNISFYLKKKNGLTNFFVATLFLTGFTAIESLDWSMNMNVYIGLFIFALGLFYQSKYFINKHKLNLFISLFLFILSIVVAPTRFTPLILIIPLIDLSLLIRGGYSLLRILLIKNIIFAIIIYLFFKIGIFGAGSGQITNTSLIHPFIQTFLFDPQLSFLIFLHWIGITILPIYPPPDISKTALGGLLFLILLIITYYKYRNKWLIVGSIIYFITLILMWLSSTLLKIEVAESRHLIVLFFGVCFLTGIISLCLERLKILFVFLLPILIIGHIYSVELMYSRWISIGRGSDLIIPIQEKIMSHFSVPITEPKIIFLDFDDPSFQQSIEFGLGYRIAVLSGTKGYNLIPTPMSNKEKLMAMLKAEVSNGKIDETINKVYAFKFKNRIFMDVTDAFRKEIKLRLNQP